MPRALWTGAIGFGLVSIPVKLYRATASASGQGVSFHQLHEKCGTRIKMVRRCPRDDVDVPWEDVVKGYEVHKGRYVIVTDEELDEILPKDDFAQIAIENFVALDEIDPIYYDRAYYVAADGAARAYALLHRALVDSGRAAIARVTLRTRSHLAVVRAQDHHLLLSTMFYDDEIVGADVVPALDEARAHVDKKQEDVARQLIDSMTTAWDPSRYHDEYTARAKRLIEEKLERGQIEESLVPAGAPRRGEVIDLMAALRKSVEEKTRPARERSRRSSRTPSRPRSRRKAG
jgi:DNA end-binding protein Ku